MRPLSLVLLVLATALSAQQQPPSKLVESVEVRVTNVDVVVTDAKGKPVTGLTRDDFTIFEDGKPQPITNFYEVRPEDAAAAKTAEAKTPDAAPPAVRHRRIVIFIDNYSLHPFRRSEVFASIDRSFDALFQPGDQAMVVAWNRGLKVVVPFTGDRAALREALRKYEKNAGAGAPLEVERDRTMKNIEQMAQAEFNQRGANSARDFAANIEGMAREYAQDVAMNEKMLIKAMSTMMTTLAGVDGKKVMLVAGSQLPARPGLEMFQYVDQIMGGRALTPTATRESSTWDVTKDLETLARQANANGVTMYMIDGGDNMRGVTEKIESRHAVNRQLEFNEFSNTAESLSLIAQMTGGMALERTNNFDLALTTMANDLAAYYSLGYKPAGEQSGDRKIVVKVKNSAYHVRARSSYVMKSAQDEAEDRVIANAFHGLVQSDFPVRLEAGAPAKYSGDKWKVPVRITFPSDITLLPNGENLEGGFTVELVVVDDDGTMSNVTRRDQPVKLPKTALRAMQSKPISFTAEMLISPGDHYISVGIVDDIANTSGFARARVRAR
jgi:VWFA-related protein